MVYVVDIPDASGGGKQGPDDFLASGGTIGGLLEHAREYSDFDLRDSAENWPVLEDEALYGQAGKVVKTMEPNTESDPVAILLEFLSRFGNIIGRGAHFEVEGDRHYLKIFHVSVGETSKGRKGTAQGRVDLVMEPVDRFWREDCVETGLSSGEGVVHRVRDEVKKEKDGETIVVDPGVKDKRLLIAEPEFAAPLTMMQREGNTLSMVIRNLWDDKKLGTLTKNNQETSTGSHGTIVGHITKSELLKHLTEARLGGGIANRFLFVLVRRSKVLPHGGSRDVFDQETISALRKAAAFGKEFRNIGFCKEIEEGFGYSADELWVDVYEDLSEGKPFLVGAVTSRAEAYVRRLATLYAVLDCSEVVRVPHLLAALAVWQYAEHSATLLFGGRTGDGHADLILAALRENKEGLNRTELHQVLDNNVPALRLTSLLKELQVAGWVDSKKVKTEGKGRPSEVWFIDE